MGSAKPGRTGKNDLIFFAQWVILTGTEETLSRFFIKMNNLYCDSPLFPS